MTGCAMSRIGWVGSCHGPHDTGEPGLLDRGAAVELQWAGGVELGGGDGGGPFRPVLDVGVDGPDHLGRCIDGDGVAGGGSDDAGQPLCPGRGGGRFGVRSHGRVPRLARWGWLIAECASETDAADDRGECPDGLGRSDGDADDADERSGQAEGECRPSCCAGCGCGSCQQDGAGSEECRAAEQGEHRRCAVDVVVDLSGIGTAGELEAADGRLGEGGSTEPREESCAAEDRDDDAGDGVALVVGWSGARRPRGRSRRAGRWLGRGCCRRGGWPGSGRW